MPSLELTNGVILVSADGINLSAPWRLGESAGGRALTPDQEADIASRFALDPEVIEILSMLLSNLLNPAIFPNLVEIDRLSAEKRAEATLRKARKDVTDLTKRLTKPLEELGRLTIARWARAEASAPFRQAHANLTDGLVHLQQAQEDIEQALKSPGAVRLDTPTDKRQVMDQRRLLVLQTLLQTWRNADRSVTISTDKMTYKRGGQLIEFVNAVVRCVTEPPSELSRETITKAVKRFLELERERMEDAGTRDDTWMEGS